MVQFRLARTLTRKVHLEAGGPFPKDFEKDRIFHTALWEPDEETQFAVAFRLELALKPKSFCKLEFVAIFETEDVIPQEFKDSHFPTVNAPAIAYPFLRAFVSQFCVIAGYENKILPVLNFAEKSQWQIQEPATE